MDTQTLTSRPAATAPVVGMGATQVFPQDRYPYVVVAVSRTGHAIWVKPLKTVSTQTGHEPAGRCNGFPVWDHTYTDAEVKALVDQHAEPTKLTRRGDGRYRPVGSGELAFGLGQARYFRNYAD
ncbi:hypothetical protein [Actinotalea ferrariae]|nr:hypothetical protein [Actinotalea ferrariae]